ncbi:uncharacterized protein Osi10a [Diachasmimorpha longicaudata]|uniref:uncharacterized protein Osi10a n=1 Tax=Diachasmimorpha longicaudata TaxID=58733 RepID=UPI0030B88A77
MMKRQFRDFLFLICLSSGITVMMEPKDRVNEPDLEPENPPSFTDVFAKCLVKKIHGTFECFNRGSLSLLGSLNDHDRLDFGDVKLLRSDGEARDLLDLDYDPKDFGNVVKAAARLMERRNLKWDMGNIYPGLQMRVGPMLNGNGVLEFVVDERYEGQADRQLGTGRMLVRSLLLPFLLGFKFSLSSLIPLVFGILLVVTKKALLLTKVALLLSGLLGWNSLVSSPGLSGFGGSGPVLSHYGYGGNHHFGFGHSGHGHQFGYRPYRTQPGDYGGYNQHVIREVVNVYDPEVDATEDDNENTPRSAKNFVWAARH